MSPIEAADATAQPALSRPNDHTQSEPPHGFAPPTASCTRSFETSVNFALPQNHKPIIETYLLSPLDTTKLFKRLRKEPARFTLDARGN
jgi:hypothetical protein